MGGVREGWEGVGWLGSTNTIPTSGCLESVEWNGGMEYWNDLLA